MHSSRRDGPCGENTGRGYLPDGSSVGRGEEVAQAPNSAILYSTLQSHLDLPTPAANSASAKRIGRLLQRYWHDTRSIRGYDALGAAEELGPLGPTTVSGQDSSAAWRRSRVASSNATSRTRSTFVGVDLIVATAIRAA